MTIYGRVDILNQIVNSRNFLINLSGEPGIGKTAVLNEAKERIAARRPAPRVILIDFKTFCDAELHADAFLRELYRQVHGKIPGYVEDLAQETDRMVNHLNENGPFILMFDSTEALQDVSGFWSWLVQDFFIPLSSNDRVRVVIAGRRNALLFNYQLNSNKLAIKLEVLTKERGAPAEMMVQNLLKASRLSLTEAELTSVCNLICTISLGHPELIKQLVDYVEVYYQQDRLEQLRSSFCQRNLVDCIKNTLLSGIRDSWKEILWWASPLREIDMGFLNNYLKRVAPNLAGLFSPETEYALGNKSYEDTHELENRGIGRKEYGVFITSEAIQHFLYQSMLYQSILEPESPGLFQALRAAIDVSLNEAHANDYVDDAASKYLEMAQEYQEKLCSAYQEAIQILNRLAEESQQDAPAFKDYTAKAKFFEAACRQNCSGNPGEVAL